MFPQDRRRSISLRVKLLKAKRKTKKMLMSLRSPFKYQRKLKLKSSLPRRSLLRVMQILAVKRKIPKMKP